MKTAGVRELRERLSEYLREVRGGETVLVMDRGQVVAEIRPPGVQPEGAEEERGLRRLTEQGRVRPPQRQERPRLPEPLKKLSAEKMQQLLDEEREDK